MDTDDSSDSLSDFSDKSSTQIAENPPREDPSLITDESSSQSSSADNDNDDESSSDSSINSSFTEKYERRRQELKSRRHPRCLYENISSRDLRTQIKCLLPGLTLRLRSLLSDAMFKVSAVHEMRKSSPLRHRQRVSQERWEELLITEYRRLTRAALQAMEADVAYFREILQEMAGIKNSDEMEDLVETGIFQKEEKRISKEIGDTRANILVHHLRGGGLMGKFLDAFRDSRRITEEDWGYADRLIALYRTPDSKGLSSHQSYVLEAMIRVDKKEQLRQLLHRSRVPRKRAKDVCRYKHLVPRCLSKYLTYIFGANETTAGIDDPANMIPGLYLRSTKALVPVLDHDTGFTLEDSKHIEKRPLPPGSEQWLCVDFFHRLQFDAGERWPLSVYKFSTERGALKPPNQAFAYFRALLASFVSMRLEGSTSWAEYVAEQEWLADSRWRRSTAPCMRKSTMVKLASMIGHVDPNEFSRFWESSVGQAEIADDDEDDDDEKDRLIANIVEELYFASPSVWIEQEELERLRLYETDIIAVMQRRRDPQHVCWGPDSEYW